MAIYIQATANISPQKTFGDVPFLAEPVEYTTNRLRCIEPDYSRYIDARAQRRMSRVIKMGVAAAMECLRQAGETSPGAFVTGTAYGCMEDTKTFLTNLVEQGEDSLQPTPFIQSTPNTVGGQVALMLKSHAYNNTFVHRGFSFEHALQDACMLLEEDEANNVLVGGIDETTDVSHAILSRFGLYKNSPVSNLSLFSSTSKGTIDGEGAAFFLLANKPSANTYARLDGIHTFYKPVDIAETEQQIETFLSLHETCVEDVDIIITGNNGDAKNDTVYWQLQQTEFKNAPLINYKHLCGEYPTSTAFALWMAANIVKKGAVPAVMGNTVSSKRIKRVLVFNHYQHMHHSLMLVSAV